MAKVPKKPVVRSAKRARLGPRTLLILAMLIILVLLLAWLLGFRPPESGSTSGGPQEQETPFEKTAFKAPRQSNNNPKTIPVYRPKVAAPLGQKDGPGPQPQANTKEEEKPDENQNAVFAHGPCWLSGRLPTPLLNYAAVDMTLVSAWAELGEQNPPTQTVRPNDGKFVFSSACQLGPVFLRVESPERVDLFGPFDLTPFEHHHLGILPSPSIDQLEQGAAAERFSKIQATCFAQPRAIPGLLSVPLVALDSYNSAQPNFDPISDWFGRAIALQVVASQPVTFDKTLGGPWEIVALDDQSIRRMASPASQPHDRVRIEGLGLHDELVFFSAAENRSFLINKRSADQIYDLPHKWGQTDRLFFIRFGDKPRELLNPEAPGQAIEIPPAGMITIDASRLTDMTLIRTGLSKIERERAIRRNRLLFHLDAALKLANQDGTNDLGGEENVRMGTKTSEHSQRIIQIPVNSGRYDLVQVRNTRTGEQNVFGQIEVLEQQVGPTHIRADFIQEPTNCIRVIDAKSGEPIADARLIIGRDLPQDSSELTSTFKTNDDGICLIPGLPSTTLDLIVSSPRHTTRRTKIEPTDFDPDSHLAEVKLEAAQELEIKVTADNDGLPCVDGIVLIRNDGTTLAQKAIGGAVTFSSLAPGLYVALPYLGRLSVTTDDWDWLKRESGGIVFEHPLKPGANQPQWNSPLPQNVILDLRVKGEGLGPISLQIVHAGAAPFPGVWPNQTYENLQAGIIELTRLIPGEYRAIATWGSRSEIVDLTVDENPKMRPLLSFDFTKD